MSDYVPPTLEWEEVVRYLKIFWPQYLDPESPQYVDEETLEFIFEIAHDSVPWCLRQAMKNYACALYVAYLIRVREETSSGQASVNVAGPVTSEKEGDITVTYADLTKTGIAMTERPPSDPWDAWKRLWDRCTRGSIITRFGDPVDRVSAVEVTTRARAKVIEMEHARIESRRNRASETSSHPEITSC